MLVVGENLWMEAFHGVIGENPETNGPETIISMFHQCGACGSLVD
jgi:hypothetical protein